MKISISWCTQRSNEHLEQFLPERRNHNAVFGPPLDLNIEYFLQIKIFNVSKKMEGGSKNTKIFATTENLGKISAIAFTYS